MIFRILVLALLIFWGVWVFNSCEQNGAEIENGTDQEDMVNDYEDTEDILDTDEEDQMEDTEDTEGSEDQMEDEDNKEDNDKVDEAFLDRTEYRGSHVRYDDKKDKDNKKPGTTTKKPVVKKPMKNTGASMGTEKGTQDSKNTTKSDTTTWKPEPVQPVVEEDTLPDRDSYVRLYVYDNRIDTFGQPPLTGRVHFEVINKSRFSQYLSIPECGIELGVVRGGETTYMGFERDHASSVEVVASSTLSDKGVWVDIVE